MHKIWVYTAVLILIAFSFSVSAQELARVTVPVIVQVPQTVTLSVDKLEIVFVSSDFQDPELAVVTDEGVLVTKRRAINVRAVGNVGYELLISTLSMPFKMEWRLNQQGAVDDGDGWSILPVEAERMVVAQRSDAGAVEVVLDFRLLTTWQDSPDPYEGTILLTVIPIG